MTHFATWLDGARVQVGRSEVPQEREPPRVATVYIRNTGAVAYGSG